eukprot:gene8068-9615_t
MAKSVCFFNLPSDVCSNVFTQWLDSKDFVKLDSAVANTHQRRLFLEMIQDPHFTLRGSDSLILASYLYWLSYRSLKVDKIVLVNSFLEDGDDNISKMDLSKLVSLSFNHGNGVRQKELTLFQRLLSFAMPVSDPYMKLFVRCGGLKHIDFGSEAHSSFGKIGMFCSKLQSIKAVHCKGLNDSAIENIAQHCRSNITSVVLRACDDLTSASAIAIAENCPNLTYIDLSYGTTFSERSLIQLASSCPKLTFINFEGLCNISDKVIATVAANCKQLRFFNIDYYKGMSHNGIDPVALKLIAESCVDVTDFVAPDFHYKVRQGKAQLQLKGVYTRLPKIRNILLNSPDEMTSLQASGCKYMNDDCIALIAPRFGANLTTLLLAGCEDITDAALAHIAQHCPMLEHLDLSGCPVTDIGVSNLVRFCRHLHTLSLRKCYNLSKGAFLNVARHLPELEKLTLSHTSVCDSVLQERGANCPLLRELELTDCKQVTKAGVQHIIATLPNIICTNFWSNYLHVSSV